MQTCGPIQLAGGEYLRLNILDNGHLRVRSLGLDLVPQTDELGRQYLQMMYWQAPDEIAELEFNTSDEAVYFIEGEIASGRVPGNGRSTIASEQRVFTA